ncbi:NAD(P)/FAD-dependent oxidoreductase [Proteiniborus sp. MB09-C3]|uniref:NAD(P)/FAD-dependent oxidoreductase n=1 Tax=Proteiniborus sp. MB09-C3 TaxID=3050072 RepID=UPI00255313DF|nr:NAD(P)/FAD-dependent oxidoreductase [Proteiniborus sp. MB09-C3]WIV12678.1 NAD(P)/FAD-dependent oxidoreductase [Proteiniborus sp. MB09-C3]
MYDIAIIGAGVIGAFIARELARYELNIVLIDKENDVSNGASKANSAIIHAGYDAKLGTNMAKFNSLGNPMFDKVCEELDVEFKRTGSFVVGFDDADMETIKELYQRGLDNEIEGLEIIDGDKVREMEPNLNDTIKGALYAPTCGIISPWELTIALAENAADNGVEILLNNEVVDIKKIELGYKIITNKREIDSKYVINCAGVYADKVNDMVSKDSFIITPRKGQYFVLDKSVGDFVNTVVFQCPSKVGKGILIAPTIHGNLLLGPDAEDIEDKDDVSTASENLEYIKEIAKNSSSSVPVSKVITTYSGLRSEVSTGDFIIGEAKDAKGFINVAGIKSPGLSSSPAIAEYVVDIMKGITGELKEKSDFNPRRRRVIRFNNLGDEEKAELIKKDPSFGRIICRCESVTEGEIVDIIRRNAGATTVDGVKRRARPGTGRCQGGFCGPRIVEILARELNKDMDEIVKDREGSYILIGNTNKGKK